MNYSAELQHLKHVIAHDGVGAALRHLNQRAGVRYSALYRFDGDTLHNMYFVDRDDPGAAPPADIPVLASYCVFVRGSGRKVVIEDSLAEEWIGDHPKRRQIRSYCGVPLLDASGRMFGTACHFDPEPVSVSPEDVQLLEALAPLLKPVAEDGGR